MNMLNKLSGNVWFRRRWSPRLPRPPIYNQLFWHFNGFISWACYLQVRACTHRVCSGWTGRVFWDCALHCDCVNNEFDATAAFHIELNGLHEKPRGPNINQQLRDFLYATVNSFWAQGCQNHRRCFFTELFANLTYITSFPCTLWKTDGMHSVDIWFLLHEPNPSQTIC